jgi:ribosome-associated translation inhibitor RaiA
MLVQVITDNHVDGSDGLQQFVETTVQAALSRFGDRVTRVVVSFADQNSDKGGDNDKRCTLEARLAGLSPVVVKSDAGTMEDAIDGAVDKLVQTLDRAVEKTSGTKGRTPMGG